jgi:predicted HD phosphohydrolase
MHVDAKRYLVATDTRYADKLSDASTWTLEVQGGPLTPDEVEAFEANSHAEDAVVLRHADEAAKIPGRDVAALESWRPAIEGLIAARNET